MPAITSITLTINGSTVPLEGIRLNEVETFNRDQHRTFSFTREAVLREDDTWSNAVCSVAINGTLVHHGRIRNRQPVHSAETGWAYAYTSIGLEFLGDDWPIVSPFDGTGSVTFNQSSTNPGYDPTYDGMSLGEMIVAVLEEPRTAAYFTAHDIGKYAAGVLDSRTLADLADDYLDDYRPANPVTFSGDNCFQAIKGVLQSAAPNYRMWFQTVVESPPGGGTARPFTLIRFADIRDVTTTKTIDLSQHPMPQVRRDYQNSFSRVVVRGGPDIRPMILDMNAGDLSENFAMPPWLTTNVAAKTAWNVGVWYNATNKQITGTCLCRRPRISPAEDALDPTDSSLADPNWLLVNPDDDLLTWSEDDYNQSSSGLAGFLYVSREPTTDWQEMVNRRVIYNSALSAGGTSYLQLDDPLPSTLFTDFTMTAGIWPGSLTWRRYAIEKLTAEGQSVAKYAQPAFPVPIPWNNTDGTPLSFTTAGVATIYFTPDGADDQRFATCGFQVDRLNESIILDRPSVTFFGQPESLETGGVDVDGQPENIRVLLPVAISPLEAIQPPNDLSDDPVYEGTSSTEDGIDKTLYVNMPEWVSETDTGPMTLWARQILDSIKDTVVEGSTIVYDYDPVFAPGVAVTYDDPCLADNVFDDLKSLVYSCLIKFNHDESGVLYHTEYALTNRRDQYRGYENPTHPIIFDPIKPMKIVPFQPGSLRSRSDYEATGGGSAAMRAIATKLDL